MPKIPCGATRRDGGECQWDVGRSPCRAHGTPRQRRDAPETPNGLEAPPRSIRETAWWVVEQVARGELAAQNAQAIVGALRILNSLDPEGEEEELAMQKAIVHGMVMHGLPPETPEQWELAEKLFDEEGMAELRRWQLVLEHNLRLAAEDPAGE